MNEIKKLKGLCFKAKPNANNDAVQKIPYYFGNLE
jgi:hypothetical protein